MGKMTGRFNDSYNNRDSGGSRRSIFDWSKLDGEVTFYKPKEGTNKIDILPYTVKSPDHPLVKRGVLKVGDLDYMFDVWVHRNIGPGEVTVICPKKTYGKPCPICDQAEVYRKAGKDEEFKAYKPTRRCSYNVLNVEDLDAGVQVFEISHYQFEKELIEEAKNSTDGAGIVEFADPDEGKTVKFRGSKTKIGTNEFLEYKAFGFLDRTHKIDKYLKHVISFDELITVPTADSLYALMQGADDDEDEAPARPVKGHDDDEDEKPAKKVEEDDDSPKCPHGHKWGIDNDETDDCDSCKMWKDCARAARNK